MTGRSKWRTERRLKIGMRVEQLLERYPAARRGRLPWIGSGWLLLPREEVCIGDCGGDETITVSALWAKTRDGRVVRFFTHLGGPRGVIGPPRPRRSRPHSWWRASRGLRRAARRAGSTAASTPATTASTRNTTSVTMGSSNWMPWSSRP